MLPSLNAVVAVVPTDVFCNRVDVTLIDYPHLPKGYVHVGKKKRKQRLAKLRRKHIAKGTVCFGVVTALRVHGDISIKLLWK